MANLGDNLWRQQKGEGHQVANAYHTLRTCDEDSIWKLEYVRKHKSYLDPQIKTYGSVDFTIT